jgi:Cu+-exporting ATPase
MNAHEHARCHACTERAADAAGHAIDPVCGMQVPTTSDRYVDHRGTRYWFCSDGCRDRFRADPERYLAAPPGAADGPVHHEHAQAHTIP